MLNEMRNTMWRLKSVLRRFSSTTTDDTLTITTEDDNLTTDRRSKSNSVSTPLISPAAATVLRTPELVEMILLHLSMQDLLPLQRTSQTIRSIILSSAPLKRKLFLNPALQDSPSQETDNPYLKSLFPKLGTYLLQGNPKWRPKFIKAITDEDIMRVGDKFWECETASWKNMLLTQPPVKEITVYAGFEEGSGGRRVEDLVNAQVAIKSAYGVTMGMVFDASLKARRKARSGDVKRSDSGYASIDITEAEFDEDEIFVDVIEVEA